MGNGKWVLSSEDEWHLALANAASLIVSTEPWKLPDSKTLVTSLTIDVPVSSDCHRKLYVEACRLYTV